MRVGRVKRLILYAPIGDIKRKTSTLVKKGYNNS